MTSLSRLAVSGLSILLSCACLRGADADQQTDARVLATTTEWVSDWNAHDATALGKLLTPDVDFVLVNGKLLHGRQEFTSVHAQQFAGRYRTSVFQQNGAADLGFIRPDVAVVHWRWSISGVNNADGSPAKIYQGIFTWVLVEADGAWTIRAAQNTVDQ
jgi:uncharacterized protein (TIGR02246 family)